MIDLYMESHSSDSQTHAAECSLQLERWIGMSSTFWLKCPSCGRNTKTKVREDTALIQEWMGHSDFSTTANIYAHLDYQSKITSAEAMLAGLGLKATGIEPVTE